MLASVPKRSYGVDILTFASKIILDNELTKMEAGVNHINLLKNEMLSTFVESFANSYNKEKGYEMTYDLNGAHEDFKSIINYRRGVKKTLESKGLTEEPEAQNASCSIM